MGWIVAAAVGLLACWNMRLWWRSERRAEELRIDRDVYRARAKTWQELAQNARTETHQYRERNAELARQLGEHEDLHELRLSAERYEELTRLFDAWRQQDAVVVEKVPVPVEALPVNGNGD